MTVVPHFLLKRLYVSGSLRQVPEGVAFDLKNVLGPGLITRVVYVSLDDQRFGPEELILRYDNQLLEGIMVSDTSPLAVLMNQTVTCIIRNIKPAPGDHRLAIEVISKEAGKVTVTVHDHMI